MPFQKEPRYYVRRICERTMRELFIADSKGTITQRTGQFTMPWTDGEPAPFTLAKGEQMVNVLNAQLPQEVMDTIATGLPKNRMWHLEPVAQ